MMNYSSKSRFWKVEWTHKRGYCAPLYYVETVEKDLEKAKKAAIKMAKERSRLTDFLNVWYFKLTLIEEDD